MRRLLGFIICILYAVSFVVAADTLSTANLALSVKVEKENSGAFGVTQSETNAKKYTSDSKSSTDNTISLTKQGDSSYSGSIWFYFYVWGDGKLNITVTAAKELRLLDDDGNEVSPVDGIHYGITFSDYTAYSDDWMGGEFSKYGTTSYATTSQQGVSPSVASTKNSDHIRTKGICKLTVTTLAKSFEKKHIGSTYSGEITITIAAT